MPQDIKYSRQRESDCKRLSAVPFHLVVSFSGLRRCGAFLYAYVKGIDLLRQTGGEFQERENDRKKAARKNRAASMCFRKIIHRQVLQDRHFLRKYPSFRVLQWLRALQ